MYTVRKTGPNRNKINEPIITSVQSRSSPQSKNESSTRNFFFYWNILVDDEISLFCASVCLGQGPRPTATTSFSSFWRPNFVIVFLFCFFINNGYLLRWWTSVVDEGNHCVKMSALICGKMIDFRIELWQCLYDFYYTTRGHIIDNFFFFYFLFAVGGIFSFFERSRNDDDQTEMKSIQVCLTFNGQKHLLRIEIYNITFVMLATVWCVVYIGYRPAGIHYTQLATDHI